MLYLKPVPVGLGIRAEWIMNFRRMVKRIIMGKSPRRTLERAGILVLVSFLLFGFLLLPIRITGISMEPTYRDGSINLVNTLRFRFRQPRRGDVVAIKLAGRRVMLLKRIVGLPGDRLAFRKGILTINGQPFLEPYIEPHRKRPRWDIPEVKIGLDEFFVVGDNRLIPPRVHYHGRVKSYRIIGGPLF